MPQQILTAILVVRPSSDEIRTATFKNAKLQLLMKLSGFERLGVEDKPDTTWIIPSALTSAHLVELQTTFDNYLETTWTDSSGGDPEDLLRRIKTTTAYAEDDEPRRDGFIDDSEGSDDLQDFMFPDNVRSKSDALDQLRKRHKKRKLIKKSDAEPLADEVLDERRKARERAALDRRRKIKSELYVRDSDEEMDEDENRAFFAREEENRTKQAQRILAVLSVGRTEETSAKKRKSERDDGAKDKRRRQSESEDERMDEDENEVEMEMLGEEESGSSPQQRAATSNDELEIEDTPLSSQSQVSHADFGKEAVLQEIPQPRHNSFTASKGQRADDSDDELPVLASQRRRVRAGFILDDSDED